MLTRFLLGASLSGLISGLAVAQVLNIPNTTNRFGIPLGMDAIQSSVMDFAAFRIDSDYYGKSPLESPSGSVSELDFKAPGKAREEYAKGYRLLLRKDMQGAIEHLTKALAIYPSFVAAHNALGSTYMNLSQNAQARDEFSRAVALDDHLPSSYLNLGCAQLSLQDYAAAEDSLKKASSIAPLDLQLSTALAYGEFVNHDYPAVIDTMREVHRRKHAGAAVVHYFAAGAFGAQGDLPSAQHELETLLQEDPKSPSANQFQETLQQIKAEQAVRAEAKLHPPEVVKFSFSAATEPTSEQASEQARLMLENIKEKNQIAEAEKEPDAVCGECSSLLARAPAAETTANPGLMHGGAKYPGMVLRTSVDEVAIFFTATDHGKSVMDLTAGDIGVRDDNQPPDAIREFRNESQLPLRLGLVIDTSESVHDRFAFEQKAAIKFLERVVTDKDDLAFVVGVNNSVLMVQDFTAAHDRISHAVNQLAPGGGTALWEGVGFAAAKLASRPEVEPVARILVVISDGQDNSSSLSLKEAIGQAQRAEVAVYTVSTRDDDNEDANELTGDHALRVLSELTGGTAFRPGSLNRLNGSLADLQQVIRGRYLVSYKPASFRRDGRYRSIDITAEKDGHKLKVYARKGYYASVGQDGSAQR
jgi:Ca-activated chloride channel homolog